MKLSASAIGSFFVLAATSTFQSAEAFALRPSGSPLTRQTQHSAFVPASSLYQSRNTPAATSLQMSYTVGIVGATGAVGKEIKGCLEDRGFPVDKLRIFGSKRSAGSTIESEKYGDITVELFDVAAARECDVVFLAVSGEFAEEHAEAICEGEDGAVVIDNSSAFRYKPEIPLVVPEINGKETKKSKLIANPNCTTAIGLMAIWPLIKKFGCKRVIMSTYQAASGAGQPGMDELQDGTKVYLEGGTPENNIFAYPLPFNVIPQIDKFMENGYTKEEMKVTWETRKICGLADDFPVSCSAVRIPTIRAHSEVIIMETEEPVDIDEAKKVLDAAPGVKLVDNTEKLEYPMPITATGKYDIEVGRLRKSLVFGDHGIEFFVSGDQLLRGAALNAVLVGEEMVKNGSIKEKAKA